MSDDICRFCEFFWAEEEKFESEGTCRRQNPDTVKKEGLFGDTANQILKSGWLRVKHDYSCGEYKSNVSIASI